MIKKLIFLIFMSLAVVPSIGQGQIDYIKEHAVRIDAIDHLNDKVSNLLDYYRLIMIGEMHGTNEPAGFARELAELFAHQGDSVQVGFEIPPDQMKRFLKEPNEKMVAESDFFLNDSIDGRASIAWASAISGLHKNPRIRVFFYDYTYDANLSNLQNRDSLMYLNIKQEIRNHPHHRTITLSGNIHNMLLPYDGNNKMGAFLDRDKELNVTGKICSLDHYYDNGTMLNNTGRGLELHKVADAGGEYSKAGYENYIMLFPSNSRRTYSGIYYTKTITASESARKKRANAK